MVLRRGPTIWAFSGRHGVFRSLRVNKNILKQGNLTLFIFLGAPHPCFLCVILYPHQHKIYKLCHDRS